MGGENSLSDACGRAEAEYDPAKDARDSYFVAIEAKRARGDTHYPEPVQQALFGESAA